MITVTPQSITEQVNFNGGIEDLGDDPSNPDKGGLTARDAGTPHYVELAFAPQVLSLAGRQRFRILLDASASGAVPTAQIKITSKGQLVASVDDVSISNANNQPITLTVNNVNCNPTDLRLTIQGLPASGNTVNVQAVAWDVNIPNGNAQSYSATG